MSNNFFEKISSMTHITYTNQNEQLEQPSSSEESQNCSSLQSGYPSHVFDMSMHLSEYPHQYSELQEEESCYNVDAMTKDTSPALYRF